MNWPDLGSITKGIHCKIYAVRRQAKRDAALESAGGTESTKALSPLRSATALQMAVYPRCSRNKMPNIKIDSAHATSLHEAVPITENDWHSGRKISQETA